MDRRVAVSGFVVAASLILVSALASDSAQPVASAPSSAISDMAAAAQLIALMRVGEHSNYIVDYTFTRVRSDGRRLPSPLTEARYGDAQFSRGSGTLTMQLPETLYTCGLVEGAPSCLKKNERASVPLSEVVEAAVAGGAYEVVHVPVAMIVGERAECFVIRARVASNELPGLGRETSLCLAGDGVPLRTRVLSALASDEWEAVGVRHDIDKAALKTVLAGFDQAASTLPK